MVDGFSLVAGNWGSYGFLEPVGICFNAASSSLCWGFLAIHLTDSGKEFL